MIYADFAATTPCRVAVADLMHQVLTKHYGNPSATGYRLGRGARGLIDTARHQAATALAAHDDQVIFTAGATESCNLAIIGVMQRLLRTRPRMLIASTEHPAVRASAEAVAAAGGEVVSIAVDHNGQLDYQQLQAELDQRCALVCTMLVNNETGVVHDLAAISAAAHKHGALVLCDATQGLGRVPCTPRELGCDLLAASGHKVYGPKGVGLLWLRRGLALAPLIHGGGQERGLRSGTENVPAIAGFGLALELLIAEARQVNERLGAFSQELEQGLLTGIPGLQIHGAAATRAPGFSMVSVPGMARGWLAQLTQLCVSAGSSCATGQGSAVLRAMGVPAEQADNAVRVSLGLGTSSDDVDEIVKQMVQGAQRLAR
ncbi:MAG: cysteine desulfurase family protein [Planctomycetota bacterium]|jgi:cysteine desulfurase|nr:cysteine desulfurase family protein [Planctomycetota bacterium]